MIGFRAASRVQSRIKGSEPHQLSPLHFGFAAIFLLGAFNGSWTNILYRHQALGYVVKVILQPSNAFLEGTSDAPESGSTLSLGPGRWCDDHPMQIGIVTPSAAVDDEFDTFTPPDQIGR